jgi:hypothetical protein
MRPALSESAGEPDAAYALATAADMQPAINVNMSFFIPTSRRESFRAATPVHDMHMSADLMLGAMRVPEQ